jgi:hypothetical protein
MERKRLAAEQEQALREFESVRRDLLALPNVVAVGLGFKETAGEFTTVLSYRVYVREKLDEAALGSGVIPKTIGGIKTDVLTPLRIRSDSDVCGNERQTLSKHRPLMAGIAISTDSTSYGTLGWFGVLDADDTPILLTNKHVLYDEDNETVTDAKKTAQPQLGRPSSCCCCECGSDNVIGESLIGIRNVAPMTSTSVDAAIARIDPAAATGLVLEITNDSTEEVLTVSGTAQAVVGETVRKIGARSAFTRGTVIHIGDMAAAPTDPDGSGTIAVRTGQVLIIPATDETYEVENDDTGVCMRAFSNSGDSGSVILNGDDEIIALNWGGNREDYSVGLTVASNIQNVLDALASNGFAITLSVSPDGGDKARIKLRQPPVVQRTDPTWLEVARDANRASLLAWLLERHQDEVLRLVNHKRAVTVAWHRHQGPAFVAAIARSARVEGYRIPFEIDGVTREQLLQGMERALGKHGSDELKRAMERHRTDVYRIAQDGETIAQLAQSLKSHGLIDVVPEPILRKAS